MALTNGTKLGPYEIVAPLGAGGMGEVYQARDTRLDRTVAIKILPAHLSDDPIRRQRFEREAKAVSSLSHPHICTLYDVGRQDGVDFKELAPADRTGLLSLREIFVTDDLRSYAYTAYYQGSSLFVSESTQ